MNPDREMSSREYEREAEASRHRLAGNLRQLSDRLTPGNIVDEVLSYAKGGGGTFLNALTHAAKDNPVPSLLIGAGLLMFLSEKTGLANMLGGHHDQRARYGTGDGYRRDRPYGEAYAGYAAERGDYAGNGRRGHGIRDTVGGAAAAARDGLGRAADAGRNMVGGAASAGAEFAGNMAEGVKDTADMAYRGARRTADMAYEGARRGAEAVGGAMAGAADAARRAAEGVGSTIAGAADEVMHRAQDFGGAVGDTTARIGQRLYDEARETPRRVSDTVVHARDSMVSMVKDQPLVAAAVGLAVGAVIAAALPKTEAEDQLMGEASDNLKDTAAKLAASEMENAKNVATTVASKVVSEVTRVAGEHGVSAEGAAAAVQAATDKIKDAVGLQNKESDEIPTRTERF